MRKASRNLAMSILVLVGVATHTATAQEFDGNGCAVNVAPNVDYFADKADVEHAQLFSVRYENTYKLLTIQGGQNQEVGETFALYLCGTEKPVIEGVTAIQIPIQSIFSSSTTHVPMILEVGDYKTIKGVANASFITTKIVADYFDTAGVIEYDKYSATDVESILAAKPDVLMTVGYENSELSQLRAFGINVVHNLDWKENSALGTAEWIKFISLFYNGEAKANAEFEDVQREYTRYEELVSTIPTDEKPYVLSGVAYEGIFYAAGGHSYVANFIRDAGGRYVFPDNEATGGFSLPDLEALIGEASKASVWINASQDYTTIKDITQQDPRLAAIQAAQEGNVWRNDKWTGAGGGVMYYELGIMRPDLILSDLVAIFHPEILPQHKFNFYTQVPEHSTK